MTQPQQQQSDDTLKRLKKRIADVAAERETLKREIEVGHLNISAGLSRLAVLDRELSELDTNFKRCWDAQQQ